MTERGLVYEDFADKVGEVFAVADEGVPATALTLDHAELLKTRQAPPGGRPPFSLIFTGEATQMLPQRLYRLEQEKMGAVTLFLVPVGKDERGFQYQALFN